jgi:hypothetical protein
VGLFIGPFNAFKVLLRSMMQNDLTPLTEDIAHQRVHPNGDEWTNNSKIAENSPTDSET